MPTKHLDNLRLPDTDASHHLKVKAGSDLNADRTLTLTTGNVDRTLDISAANVTISSFAASFLDDITASFARTTLEGTDVGQSFFVLNNPSAITFPRINADNSVSALSASDFRTAIGAGSGSGDALTTNPLSQFAATTSLQLKGVISDETGSGALVFATSPALTTPDIGTPSAGTLTNCSGLPAAGVTGTAVVQARSISTTAPLTGGGDLSANRTLAISDFVAAGGSAAKGSVPAPGATAHTNQPYYLGDDAAWHILAGLVIGTPSTVATAETTTSATAADLATSQAITFSVDATSSVLVRVSASVANTGAGNSMRLWADVDGSDTEVARTGSDTANAYECVAGELLVTGLTTAANPHTITLQFSTSAGTATFRNRSLVLERIG